MFPKCPNFFNINIEFSHNVSHRNIAAAKPTANVQLTFLVGNASLKVRVEGMKRKGIVVMVSSYLVEFVILYFSLWHIFPSFAGPYFLFI